MAYLERYYFTFNETQDKRNPLVFNSYEVKILEKDGYIAAEEIQAVENPVQINYQNTSELILEPVIGSEATLNLIATVDFQLENLYTEDELRWLIEIYRNGSVIWRGFIIPDGCQESFTFAPYTISVNAVDTLGLLKNLAYVQNDGNFWLGKQSYINVIYNCLNRVEIPDINIYTCVNIYEEDYPSTDTDDPLALTFVNAETYLKSDNINPLSCEEVLKNIMQVWTARIIQSEGDWYIYRANESVLSESLVFRKYVNGVYSTTVTKNLGQLLGGESEGLILAPLFHTNTDQLKMTARPFKNNSISFKFGTNYNLNEELDNPDLSGASQGCGGDPIGPCDTVTIPGWTKTGTMYAGLYPTGGVIFYDDSPVNITNYYENDNIFAIPFDFRLRLKIGYKNPDPLFNSDMNFQIIWNDGIVDWHLQADGTWAFQLPYVNSYSVRSDIGESGSLTIESQPVLTAGTIIIRILAPSTTNRNIVYTNIAASVFQDLGDQVGEIHTATQSGNFSFVPDTIDVLNGDATSQQYMGAMFQTDEVTLTSNWWRKYASESALAVEFATYKPLLRLAVEETERMHQKPYIKFDGSIFGYFNPMSRFKINLLTGFFIPLQLSYDLQANKCRATLARMNNDEFEQVYSLEPDYGATTKVLVKGTP